MGYGCKASGIIVKQRIPCSYDATQSQITQAKSLSSWIVGHNAPFEKETSPGNLITKDFPATFILCAEEDELIPPKQSYDLYDALKACGVDAEIGVGTGMKHGQLEGLGVWEKIEEGSGWWDEVILPALTFAIDRMA